MIRFCDEELDLCDICQFSTKIKSFPDPNVENVFIECDLMYSKIEKNSLSIFPNKVIILLF